MEDQWLTWEKQLQATASIAPAASGFETVDVDFLGANKLPPLSMGRVLGKDIYDAFQYQPNGRRMVFCD